MNGKSSHRRKQTESRGDKQDQALADNIIYNAREKRSAATGSLQGRTGNNKKVLA
jgi:hypothetical protein